MPRKRAYWPVSWQLILERQSKLQNWLLIFIREVCMVYK